MKYIWRRLSRIQKTVLLAAVLLILAINFGPSEELFSPPPSPSSTPAPVTEVSSDSGSVAGMSSETEAPPQALYQVVKVVDGDTLKIEFGGKIETIRLVGVNTPETVDPRRPVQCFGKEASQELATLVINQKVYLETDETQSDRDRYGRLLRFVFLPDGTDIGLELLKQGFAQEALYSDVPHKYHEAYLAAQDKAQRDQLGLWNPQTCFAPNPR